MKYYKVICERAHVGRGVSASINFYYRANNALQAMDRAKQQRGIKRGRIPLQCYEVSEQEYLSNITTSAYIRAGVRD